MKKETNLEVLRQLSREAAAGPLKGILAAIGEPLVSIDYKGDHTLKLYRPAFT